MKKILTVLVFLALITVCLAQITPVVQYNRSSSRVEPGQQHTGIMTWAVVDTTTTSGDEPNDLAVTERTYVTVSAAAEGGDDEISTYTLTSAHNRIRLRCIGKSEASVTYQIYFGTLGTGTDCELAKAGQLAFTVGTQVSTTTDYEMAESVTVTEYDWCKGWLSSSPGSNGVAEATIDTMGADLLVAVPTTADCDCKLLIKGY